MKRKIYDRLLHWKNESNGKTALLIEGARRVGKSYIVGEFAEQEYSSHLIINFSSTSPKIKKLFRDDLDDVPILLQKLSNLTKTRFVERDTLIVFDEVQKFPRAREAIKFLVEDGRYDYIETGSLISIHENIKDIIIPSEEQRIQMYPMDFEEFCWALGDEVTIPTIREHMESMKPFGGDIHSTFMDVFRQYLIVGGMPMAVKTFAETRDFSKVEEQKRQIISLYREDIGKRAKVNRRRTSALYEAIASELSKHDKQFSLSDIDSNGKYANYENSIYWLEESMIANLCYNSTEPGLALGLNREMTRMKLYMGDTGLLVSMAMDDDEDTEHELYVNLLQDRLHVNEGMFVENMVAQMLRANGHKLYFHAFYRKDENGNTSKNRSEVDFLVRHGGKISAIEVKSAQSKPHASLDHLMKVHSKSLGQCYVLHTKDIRKEGDLLYLPVYMAICL